MGLEKSLGEKIEEIQWHVVQMPVESLVPYEKNPRIIDQDAVEKMKAAIRRVGFHRPITATMNGTIIGGHVRIRALKELGTTFVNVSIPDRVLTQKEFDEVLIADNAHFGIADMQMMGEFEIADLDAWGVADVVLDELTPAEVKEKKVVIDDSQFCVLIEFQTEAAQADFFEEMQTRGITCKIMS